MSKDSGVGVSPRSGRYYEKYERDSLQEDQNFTLTILSPHNCNLTKLGLGVGGHPWNFCEVYTRYAAPLKPLVI